MPEAPSEKKAAEKKEHKSQVKKDPEGARPAERFPGEYVIGPGDLLAISIWQGIQAELRNVVVSERGLISFGYLDDVQAAGLTMRELDDLITKKLSTFIRNPRIEVSLRKAGSRVVRVMGSVPRPSSYNVARTITVLDAILLAGGHITSTARGDLGRVTIRRGDQSRRVNILQYISGSEGGENPFLENGDLVFVPELPPAAAEQERVYLFGEAKRPGVYNYITNMRVLDAVARAGGFDQYALKDQVRIIRGDPERPEVLTADIKAMLERGDRRGDLLLRPNDVVFIPRTVIGDLNEFVKQVSPILDFLFYPARFREMYSINSNVLRFDVGGPSAKKAERASEGTFTAGEPTTQVILR